MFCDLYRCIYSWTLLGMMHRDKVITYPSRELKMDEKNYPSLTRAYSGGVCPLDLETLLVWCSCRCVYRP